MDEREMQRITELVLEALRAGGITPRPAASLPVEPRPGAFGRNASGPKASCPDGSGPKASCPDGSGPKASCPDGSGPKASCPDGSGPKASGQAASGQAAPQAVPQAVPQVAGAESADGIVDIGSPEFKRRIGVAAPHNPKALRDLQSATGARVALGKRGARPTCAAYLRFLADHARSKGTVFKEIPQDWLDKNGLATFETLARDKDTYLTRPDLGRRLSPETLDELKKRYPTPAQALVILSDGLSSDAMLSNYEEILPVIMRGFEALNISASPPFFLKFGRVKAEDVIGETLGSKAVVLLIGERPGLGQSESMSCYAVYNPTAATVESDRTVISNIHHGGLPPVEAGAVIVELVANMLKYQASGIELNRKMGNADA